MIDEKKIEEIAENCTRKAFNECPFEAISEFKLGAIYGIKAGVNWLLDNLWHDASEEAQKDKDLLVERIYHGEKDMATDRANTLYDSWKTKVNREEITRWLYIEDLLEGGK